MKYIVCLLVLAGCGELSERVEVKQGAETAPNCGLTACDYWLDPAHQDFSRVALQRGQVAIWSGTGYTGTCQMLYAANNGSSSTEYDLAAKGWFPSNSECGTPNASGTHGSRIRSFLAGPDTTFVLFPYENGDPTMQGGQTPCQACQWSENQSGDAASTCSSMGAATTFEWASVRTKQTPTNPGFSGWSTCSGWGTTGTYYNTNNAGNLASCGAPTSRYTRLCSGMAKGNCVWVAPTTTGSWYTYNLGLGTYWRADNTGTSNMPLSSHAYGYYSLSHLQLGAKAHVRLLWSGSVLQELSPSMSGYVLYWQPDQIQLYSDP